MMDRYGYGSDGWLMFMMMVVVVVAITVAVIFLVRATTTGGQSPPGTGTERQSPKDVLKRRYAAGEIDREEFQQRLTDLDL